jgi:aquaporin Z
MAAVADSDEVTPAPQPMVGGVHLGEWACELVGTATLLLCGLSAVALDFGPNSPVADAIPSASARRLLTGLLFAGTGALVAISPLGRRSGGHLNPAMTLAFWATGRVHHHDLGGFVTAQLVGALTGATLFTVLWGNTASAVGHGATSPGDGTAPLAAAGLEALMTALLVTVVFTMLSSVRTARWTPVAVWLLVATLVWQVAPTTGTSLNPARSFGPAVLDGGTDVLWVYVVGPVVGALAVAIFWRSMRLRLLTTKLFHDPHYPSVMETQLPAMPAGWHPHR